MGKPGVAFVLDEGVVFPSAIAAGNLQTLVGGTVVNDDQLKILFGLGPDGFDGIPQPPAPFRLGMMILAFTPNAPYRSIKIRGVEHPIGHAAHIRGEEQGSHQHQAEMITLRIR